MKKNLFSVALALSVALSFAPYQPARAAGGEQPVNLQQVDGFRYLVRISNPGLLPTTLRLSRQTDSTVLYEVQSSAATCGQQLNLSNLADGTYQVVVSIGKTDYRYQLRIQTTTQRQAVVLPGTIAGR